MMWKKLLARLYLSEVPAAKRSSATDAIATTARCPFQQTHQQKDATAAAVTPATTRPPNRTKPFKDIPAAPGLPLIGTNLQLLANGGSAKIHEYCDKRHQKLGPIFRERLGTVDAVCIADKQMMQLVYLSEGEYPRHMVPEPWRIYNKANCSERGLFFMDGPDWKSTRKILNRVLLRPDSVSLYASVFNEIVTDILEKWKSIQEGDRIVPNLEKDLYKWSIESLGAMIFGRRLTSVCLPDSEEGVHDFEDFVSQVQQIFAESAKMTIIPPFLAAQFNWPVWRRFVKAAQNALHMARYYVEDNALHIAEKKRRGEPVTAALSKLLMEGELSQNQTVNLIADLFVAAADTTSHATQWALYLLAKNPESQQRLLSDIERVVPPGEMMQETHLEQIPYTRWIIKEALRLYPVAPFLTRYLPQDITLGGYVVPKDTLILMSLYTMGRNPNYFKEPERFFPERWNREGPCKHMSSPNACLPFGVGARACIGRRVAEVQMQFLIARTVQHFQLESTNTRDVGINMRMITTPDEPIRLRVTSRST